MGDADDGMIKEPVAVSNTTDVALMWAAVRGNRQGARRKGKRRHLTCHRDSTFGTPSSWTSGMKARGPAGRQGVMLEGKGSCWRGKGSCWKARGPTGRQGVLLVGMGACWKARGPAGRQGVLMGV